MRSGTVFVSWRGSDMRMPCLTCGELSTGSRCPDCTRARERGLIREWSEKKDQPSATARGYDHNWAKLSARARRLQPFCTACGDTEDLQTDHTPQAWERREKGLPIRLQDVTVLCGPCNRRAGAARGESVTRSRRASAAHRRRRQGYSR